MTRRSFFSLLLMPLLAPLLGLLPRRAQAVYPYGWGGIGMKWGQPPMFTELGTINPEYTRSLEPIDHAPLYLRSDTRGFLSPEARDRYERETA